LAAQFVVDPSEGAFSVFAWVNGGASGQAILSQDGGVDWLRLDPLDGSLMTELSAETRSPKDLHSSGVVTDGQWHRVGFCWDGTSRRLYLDDVLIAEDTQKNLKSSSGDLLIGCDKSMTDGASWTGLIDDVRIYNRTITP
jgi:hypothetical protein